MNDDNLNQLVNLLSYLKKHDDVESELVKKIPRTLVPATPYEAATTGHKWKTGAETPPEQGRGTGYSTAAGGSANAYQINTDAAEPNFPSSVDSSTQEIRDRVATSTPSVPGETEIYVPEKEKEFEGPRGGSKGYQSSTPEGQERKVVSPSDKSSGPSMVEDPLTGVSRRNYNELPDEDNTSGDSSDNLDWLVENETLDWLEEHGIRSFADLKGLRQTIANFVPKVKGPEPALHHLIRSVDELPEGAEATYRRMLGKNGMAKSSESILLSLLKRLGT